MRDDNSRRRVKFVMKGPNSVSFTHVALSPKEDERAKYRTWDWQPNWPDTAAAHSVCRYARHNNLNFELYSQGYKFEST